MKKRFKTKKKNRKKNIFYFSIIILSFYLTLSLLIKDKKEFKNAIINSSVNYITKGTDLVNVLKTKLSSPRNVIYNSLNKVIPYESIKVFSEGKDIYFDYDNAKSEYVYETDTREIESPVVYIYNTHQLEEYTTLENNEHSISPNVMIASFMLKEKLNNLGINTIVETANIKSYLNKNNMSYYESYDASRYYATKTLKKNKTIRYVIDLHRDALKKEYSTVTYKKKNYAKIMFVVGLGNPNHKSNLNFAKKLNKEFEKRVPGITRTITKYSGDATNANYNQDLSKNAFLIEVGGQENNIVEVDNTLDVLADILNSIIKGSEK